MTVLNVACQTLHLRSIKQCVQIIDSDRVQYQCDPFSLTNMHNGLDALVLTCCSTNI